MDYDGDSEEGKAQGSVGKLAGRIGCTDLGKVVQMQCKAEPFRYSIKSFATLSAIVATEGILGGQPFSLASCRRLALL